MDKDHSATHQDEDPTVKELEKENQQLKIQLLKKASISPKPTIYFKYKDLIHLIIGFGLTTLLGTIVANYFQNKTWEKDTNSELITVERQAATEVFKEISSLMDKRLYRSKQILKALSKENYSNNNIEDYEEDYSNSVDEWNENITRILASTQRYFGTEQMRKIRSDLDPNFKSLKKIFEQNWKESELNPFDKSRAFDLITSLELNIFQFNLELITKIQNSKVGLFKEKEQSIINLGKYQYFNPEMRYPKISNPERLSEKDVKNLVMYYQLHNIPLKNPNHHLSFTDGDVAYWVSQGLTEEKLNLELKARRYLINEAELLNKTIKDQGALSWEAQQIILQ